MISGLLILFETTNLEFEMSLGMNLEEMSLSAVGIMSPELLGKFRILSGKLSLKLMKVDKF